MTVGTATNPITKPVNHDGITQANVQLPDLHNRLINLGFSLGARINRQGLSIGAVPLAGLRASDESRATRSFHDRAFPTRV